MHVAVCIVGYRNSNDILGCLKALEKTEHRDYEVVICENGGPVAHAALADVAPDRLVGGQKVHTFCAIGNLGYAGGVNACIEAAPNADAWWVLNPDTEPTPSSMGGLLARISRPDCDAAGCSVVLASGAIGSFGGIWQAWLGRAVSIGRGQNNLDENPPMIEEKQNYLSGASMMISREFLKKAGPMRTDYFLYCEEIEWCIRGRRNGARIGFSEKSKIIHHQGTTMGEYHDLKHRSKLPVYLTERNRILLTMDLFPLQFPIVLALTIPLLILKYGRRGAWRQILYGMEGAWAALKGERGQPAWYI